MLMNWYHACTVFHVRRGKRHWPGWAGRRYRIHSSSMQMFCKPEVKDIHVMAATLIFFSLHSTSFFKEVQYLEMFMSFQDDIKQFRRPVCIVF